MTKIKAGSCNIYLTHITKVNKNEIELIINLIIS